MLSTFPGRGERPAYCALTGASFALCGSPGRSVNCAAGEKARFRIQQRDEQARYARCRQDHGDDDKLVDACVDRTGTRHHHAGHHARYPNQAQRLQHIKTREETGVDRALYIRRNGHAGSAPSARPASIWPTCAVTSALNRSIDCAQAFIALAMIMLPTGTRIAMSETERSGREHSSNHDARSRRDRVEGERQRVLYSLERGARQSRRPQRSCPAG